MYLIRTRQYSTAFPSKMHTMKSNVDKRIKQCPVQNPSADSLELCSSLNSDLSFHPGHHPMPGHSTRPVQTGHSARGYSDLWVSTFQSKDTHLFYHKSAPNLWIKLFITSYPDIKGKNNFKTSQLECNGNPDLIFGITAGTFLLHWHDW